MAKQNTAAAEQATPQGNGQNDILLIYDKLEEVLKAVSKLEQDGKHETVQANSQNRNSFLKLDKASSIIGAFWDNLVSQFKNPTDFNLVSIKESDLDNPKVKKLLNDLATGKETKAVKDFLEKYEIRAKTPEQSAASKIDWDVLAKMGLSKEELQKTGMYDALLRHASGEQVRVQEVQPQAYKYSESLMPWEDFERIGVSKEMLVQRGLLDQMLKGYKTNVLVPLTLNAGPALIRMEARLSLMPDENGLRMYMNGVKQAPDFDRAFMGHIFSEEDKKNLRETGNMGRTVELRGRDGQFHESFVSIDKLTNDIVALKVENAYIPNEIRGVKLSDEQLDDLKSGKAIQLDGMISNKGKEFSSKVQFNAERRGIEYIFENDKLFNAQELGGVKITDKMRNEVNAGKAVLVENMVGKNGELYDRYIKLEGATGVLQFLKYNPDSPEDARQVIIPKEVNGVRLTAEDRQQLGEGKPVYVENMTMPYGGEQSRWAKVDLNTGNVRTSATIDGFDERPSFKVPQEVMGAKLSASERAQLQDGKAVLIEGIKAHDGKTISQYGRMNNVTGKIDLYNDNPDRKRDASQRNVVTQRQSQNTKKGQGHGM